ncbi:MAG: HAD-IIB family hydrolase [Verrucomicrobia bacterium]|nr:HAD-IIB family hydrolase [Verrucomicrobiota bacterium]
MHIHLYSLHGLFRGQNLEIGRDADNGGQIIYVMELARALSQRPEVTMVHLFTRRMDDPVVGPDYANPVEKVSDKLTIRRVWCGGKKYLPKEQLWPHLDEYVTNAITHIKSEKVFPNWIHGHYADAGYVATELSSVLNVPFAQTGHSLGKPKLEKLIASGMVEDEAMVRYCFERRFAAEDGTLANAEFIVTSTDQEVQSYEAYPAASQAEFHVIPPGIDFKRYYPYLDDLHHSGDTDIIRKQVMHTLRLNLEKFFSHPDRPFILAICRPDRKKNIDGLIHAFGTDPELQAIANLAIFAGLRSDITQMPEGEKEVLTEILLLMDKYNLYGRLAIPKKHDSALDVPQAYRFCAGKRGVFVNIALTEPFGLTLLEATACGCPVVATAHGGPSEIVRNCENGILVEPDDTAGIQSALKKLLTDEEYWQRTSNSGMRKVREHYSWEAHVDKYIQLVGESLKDSKGYGRKNLAKNPKLYERLKVAAKMIITDIDGTLISETGDYTGLDELRERLRNRGNQFVFGIASGRSLPKVRDVLAQFDIPKPDLVICSVGTYIYYGLDPLFMDKGWMKHINYGWNAEAVRASLAGLEGIEAQDPADQNPFKVSYFLHDKGLTSERITEKLGKLARNASVVITQSAYLDILPKRASKGRAVRYIGNKWSIPITEAVVCGDAGNDVDMFTGASRGIVVGNHAPEMEPLRELKRVYFAQGHSAAGILEGLRHFQFLD